ncbi:MAG TPA: (Fe-S)-binding protein [Kofleriaceae bacterium]|nr:(Fe-S)-binding protein [Kofleriaceae bacterium]
MPTPARITAQLEHCSFCPKLCRHACPVSAATGREALTPQAKMERLNHIRLGRVPLTAETAEPIWGCTGCRQCTVYCEHDNEPGRVLMAGRVLATQRGAGHPALADYPARFRAREDRLVTQLHSRIPAAQRTDDAAIGFWPGCDGIGKGTPDVLAALALFQRAGAGHVKVVDSGRICGGYPLIAAGYLDGFRWHAAKVASALRRFRTVVVNCSACVYTLRALYPAEGVVLSPEIVSLAEFLASLVDRIPRPEERRIVYYHDPCYLARYAGVTEAPRRVLSRVAELREMHGSEGDTECCGGGGLLPKTMPAAADAMARRRLAPIASRGGGTVVTSCATCSFMLKRNAPSSVEVCDLASYVTAQITEPAAAL